MKGKLKQTKGITLIALIITIIILLILAAVSIRLVINGGIIDKSKYAVDQYSEEEKAEQEKLLQAEYEMAKYEGKFSGSYEEYLLDKNYGLKIGDYVNYNELSNGIKEHTTDTNRGEGGSKGTQDNTTGKYSLNSKTYITEDLNWRVLGINSKGELELISDNPTTDTLYLANEEGYLNAETIGDTKGTLDTFCNDLYGKGANATGARSLNVEDVNKLIDTGYDPKTYYRYGNKWTYRYPTREEAMNEDENENPKGETSRLYMQCKKSTDTKWKDIKSSSLQKFRMPGTDVSATLCRTNPGISEILEVTNYHYNVSDKVKKTASDGNSLSSIITEGTVKKQRRLCLSVACFTMCCLFINSGRFLRALFR